MYPILISTFITLVTLLLDIRWKSKRPAYKYLALFFFIAGINFFFQSRMAEAQENNMFAYRTLSGQIILTTEDKTSTKKTVREVHRDQMVKCKEKMDYHFEEGCRFLEEAKACCLLLPSTTDQEKALACLNNFIATLSPNEPKAKAIGALLSVLGQYAFFVMREWQLVDNRLIQSKYHFEMEEHYRIMGKYVQSLYNAEKK